MPWRELCALIEPFYPRSGNGRPPVGLERMLRLHCLQHWFNLSDPAAEESLYDSLSMRRFVGIDLGREPVPDETTILNFRHLLERHNLGNALFDRVNEHLDITRDEGGRRHYCRCHHHRGAELDQEPAKARTRRCTRPAKASNGISG